MCTTALAHNLCQSLDMLTAAALSTGKTIREPALEKGLFTQEQLDVILSPQEMTHPGIAGLSVMQNDTEA